MLKRSEFKSKVRARERAPRAFSMPKPNPGAFRLPAPVAGTVLAAPKDDAYRSPRLLEMARGMPCLLRRPGICNRDPLTTVAAHSNWACHGKGKSLKAADAYTCWACSACHAWLDQGSAPRTEKLGAFMLAHADQVLLWRQIAADPARPPADRKAAQGALTYLNATPTPTEV